MREVHMPEKTYLGRRHSPHFEVIGSHEEIGDPDTGVAYDPFVKVLGFCVGNTCLESGVDHTLNTFHLVFFGEH